MLFRTGSLHGHDVIVGDAFPSYLCTPTGHTHVDPPSDAMDFQSNIGDILGYRINYVEDIYQKSLAEVEVNITGNCDPIDTLRPTSTSSQRSSSFYI